MRRQIIRLSSIGSAIIIALSFGVVENLFLFIAVGEIPGTSLTLPASIMGVLYCFIVAILIMQITVKSSTKKYMTAKIKLWLSMPRPNRSV